MDCFGTYFTHAQSCDNVRVPSASGHMLNLRVFAFSRFRVFVFSRFLRFRVFCVFVLHSFSSFRAFAFACFRIFADFKCYTEWTASVHTLHMPKAVITFVFKVLRNGLLRCIL